MEKHEHRLIVPTAPDEDELVSFQHERTGSDGSKLYVIRKFHSLTHKFNSASASLFHPHDSGIRCEYYNFGPGGKMEDATLFLRKQVEGVYPNARYLASGKIDPKDEIAISLGDLPDHVPPLTCPTQYGPIENFRLLREGE